MMALQSIPIFRSKFGSPISHLFPTLNFSLSFHQFAPPKPRRKPSVDDGNRGGPNLLHHKDWLSRPEAIRIFQELKDPDQVLPLFSELSARKDYSPNENLYATVIHKLAVAKNFDGIETLMARIKLERKCRLSDAFFRDLIKIYGHSAGRINKAIETLFGMPAYKCWPSVKTFNFVLNLLVSTKQFEVIHEVFMGASKLGIEIDACCLNIIIKGLCENGQIEAAHKVLDEFPQQKCLPNVRTFSTLMHAMCQRGRVDESFDLLKRMEDESVEIDAVVFNILISGLRKQGRFKEGVELFEQIMAKGCKPNEGTYQEVLYCLLDEKRFLEAKGVIGKMMEMGMNPSFESYKMVIKGFCVDNLAEEVEWALKKMALSGFMPRMGTWREAVRCLVLHESGSFVDSVRFCKG
ncbi:pentatricopeptide repeat-containing protein [Striga asiatica]|uniref:Pentatricopeptide repeat-containing protein n=1 Tax=Striga asiatica TaxID=4170 RepID=A0A5A7QF12_STRAF|nr:pentatricopeptide repeat-containing protein [Striga asiatica]